MILSLTTFNCKGVVNNVHYVRNLLEHYDIVCLQEHFLNEDNIGFLHNLRTDYKCFARCESYVSERGLMGTRGGVAILWKTEIDCIVSKLDDISNSRIQGIKVTSRNVKPLFVLNVYLPSNINTFEVFMDYFNGVWDLQEYYCRGGR
jgi:exonuclease III